MVATINDEARMECLSPQACGSGGVIQPILRLIVGPTRNRKAHRRASSLSGMDGRTFVREQVGSERSGAMNRRGVG